MQILNEITNYPKQKFTVITTEGEEFTLKLNYSPTQQLWFFDIEYNDFILNNHCAVTSYNMLKQWKNILPFGMGIICTDEGDPYFIDDFSSKRCRVTILSIAEVEELERLLNE